MSKKPRPRALTLVEPLALLLVALVVAVPPLLLYVGLHPLHFLPGPSRPLVSVVKALQQKFFFYAWRVLSPLLDSGEGPDKGPILARASGVVLEIGAGVGDNIKYYDRKLVTRLIVVEPNADMHPRIRARAAKAGYTDADGSMLLLGCGGAAADEKALAAAGVTEGSVDTVVTVCVLCGVPRPAEAIEFYRRLLKKGGKLLWYEHVRSADATIAKAQSLYTRYLWQGVCDGCCLDRPTGAWIVTGPAGDMVLPLATGLEAVDAEKASGKRWREIEMRAPEGQEPYACAPRVLGWAIKA